MPSWSIDGISAVTLAVSDMAKSVAFYRALGLDVSYGGPDTRFTTMRAGPTVINLRHATSGTGSAWGRVILRVRGVDALHDDLVQRGLAPTAPRDAEWGERYFEISAPEGVVISFAELPDVSTDATRRPCPLIARDERTLVASTVRAERSTPEDHRGPARADEGQVTRRRPWSLAL
jgi:catechol 2,3-dioxygenase-like lactoylglutathione lyase family enzyme